MTAKFVWGDVQSLMVRLSGPKIEELSDYCKELMHKAECARSASPLVIKIALPEDVKEGDEPWSRFKRFGYAFKLDYTAARREYVLNFDKEVDPPETPNGRPKKSKASAAKAARGKTQARGEARPAPRRRPPKATDRREAIIWYNILLTVAGRTAQRSSGAMPPFSPLRLAQMEKLRDQIRKRLAAMRTGLSPYVRYILSRITYSFISLMDFSLAKPSAGAQLVPTLLARNLGLQMSLYTFVSDKRPMLWSAALFGVQPEESEPLAR